MTYNVANNSFKVNGFAPITTLSVTTGIDGTSATTTNLFTVPTGKKAVVVSAIVRLTAVTGFSAVGTAGIGIASGESDIFASVALTGLSTTIKAFSFVNNVTVFVVGQSTEVIKLGIDVGYTATSATLAVDLLGYIF